MAMDPNLPWQLQRMREFAASLDNKSTLASGPITRGWDMAGPTSGGWAVPLGDWEMTIDARTGERSIKQKEVNNMATNKEISELKELLQQQDAELKRIAESPLEIATVVEVGDVNVMIATGGGITRVLKPNKFKVAAGDSVLLFSQTKQIVEKLEKQIPIGEISFIRTVNGDQSEVESSGNSIVVLNGAFKPEKGDRVVLDSTGSVIISNLGKADDAYALENVPDVTWDDIGGLHEAKEQMKEMIEAPHKNKDLYKYYGKKHSKGVLLYGGPGCGKTMLAKAAANSLAKIYKGKGAFIYIKGPEILNKYVGESEATVRSLFATAREHKQKHGFPAVLFIDEADAILGERGRNSTSGMEGTVVPMFLAEMDGLDDNGAFVILATNRPDSLDSAVVRDGRIDRKIKITRPSQEDAVEILKMNLKKAPLQKGLTIDDLAKQAAADIYSLERILYNVKTSDDIKHMRLSDTVNGGMIAGVVDFAMSVAIRRDMASGKQSGLCKDDMKAAVEAIDKQSRDLSHKENIEIFTQPFKAKVKTVTKMVA